MEVDGFREPGLLLPVRTAARWQGFLFALLGVFLLGIAVTLAVLAVADQKWVDLVGVLVRGASGAFSCGQASA